MRPAALHIADVRQWRKALEAGPLTNAKRGGKAKGKRPASPAKGASSSVSDAPKKISRASAYSKDPKGEVAWPPSRCVGRHRLGWHETGSRNTKCDYPCCLEVDKTIDKKDDGSSTPAGPSTPRGRAMPPPPPRSGGSCSTGAGASATSSRAPSPAPSETSSTCSTASTRGHGVTKMYCLDCYDPSNARPMNFHAECWNLWHGRCDECDT